MSCPSETIQDEGTGVQRGRGRPPKGADGTEGRKKWTIRAAPSVHAKAESLAKEAGLSVADWFEALVLAQK